MHRFSIHIEGIDDDEHEGVEDSEGESEREGGRESCSEAVHTHT